MARIFDLIEWPTPATHLYEKYASALSERLRMRFPRFDRDWIYDAIIGAVLDIALKFDQLDDPDELGGLLTLVATRKLLEMHRSEQARHCREQKIGRKFVAQRQAAAREEWEALADGELLERIFAVIPENDQERLALEHWGESYQDIACALGWQQLPDADQKTRVKLIRDRLAQRLKRFLEE